MRRISGALAASILIGWLCGNLVAQTLPTTKPARPRVTIQMPPGFKSINIQGRTALVEAADEEWVKQALESQKPTTMPATTPATVLAKFQTSHAELVKQIVADLLLNDSSSVAKFFVEKFEPDLKELEAIHPPVFYMITTEARLKEMLKAGWSDDRFYYNRVADTVAINSPRITPETAADDIILPIVLGPTMPADEKNKALSVSIVSTESRVAEALRGQAVRQSTFELMEFVAKEMGESVKFTADQKWFPVGAAGVLCSRYTATITGYGADEILKAMSADLPGNPIRAAVVDLLHPVSAADLRPGAFPYYQEAFRSKATRVMRDWVNHTSAENITKTLGEIRKNPPADGSALVKQLQQISGMDLTKSLGPDY